MTSPRHIIGTVATVAALALPAVFSSAALAQETDVSQAIVSPAQTTTMIAAQNIRFEPAELHATPGTTVVWTNNDPFAHTATSVDGIFDSGLLDPGATFSFTFTEPGVYSYYCIPHGGPDLSGMAGTVVVEGPATEVPVVDVPADVPATDVPAVEAPGVIEQSPAPVPNPEGALSPDRIGRPF